MIERPPTRSLLREGLRWLPALLPLGLGGAVGYASGYQMTLPELASLGGIFLLFLLGGAIAVIGVVGLIALVANRGSLGSFLLITAGCLLVGGLGGFLAVRGLERGYREPVVLHAAGTTNATLTDSGFAPATDGQARCDSVAGGTAVSDVTAVALGDLREKGMLRAQFGLSGQTGGQIELFVDAADSGGLEQPFWSGPVVLSAAADGATGTATFTNAALEAGGKSAGAPAGWPPVLSGSITWTCASWTAADATPPPDAVAMLTLDLPGVALGRVPTSPSVTCSFFGATGAVSSVASVGVYQMRQWPFEIRIGLTDDARVGDPADVSVQGSGKNPPSGQVYMPSWSGKGAITVLGPAGRSGTVTFDQLPTGVDPSVGPAPTGFPTKLTGTVTWICG